MSKGLLIATATASVLVQASKAGARRRVPLLVDIFTQVGRGQRRGGGAGPPSGAERSGLA